MRKALYLAAIWVASCLPVVAQSGYPWWLITTVTPTSGYVRVETAYSYNATATVIRLLGIGVTNQVNNGRTTTVYFAQGFTNTYWSEGLTNSFSFTGNTAYISFKTNYSGGAGSEPLWIAESNLYARIEYVTNAFQQTTNYINSLPISSNVNSSLWSAKDAGEITPNTNATVTLDMYWRYNALGELTPRSL